jgi:uncharacterized membrane protein
MQVEMATAQDTEEVRQPELDVLIAQTRELLSTSEEFRERIDRTVNESITKIYTLLQIPRD